MSNPTQLYGEIRHLATGDRPGALSVAEQSIDRQLALLANDEKKLLFLDTLARDLFSLEETKPELAKFLRQMQSYIDLMREQLRTQRA